MSAPPDRVATRRRTSRVQGVGFLPGQRLRASTIASIASTLAAALQAGVAAITEFSM
jgi:hypothetical protein